MGDHVDLVFHYRITEFMRLVVHNVQNMDSEDISAAAEWILCKIRERIDMNDIRYLFSGDDNVRVVDHMVNKTVIALLYESQKRELKKISFEVDLKPKSMNWRLHVYKEEKFSSNSQFDEYPSQYNDENHLEADFADFLAKLEQRQEQIKETARRTLAQQARLFASYHIVRQEKAVQTPPPDEIPDEAFVPELPAPNITECHETCPGIEAGDVDCFVDALFEFKRREPILDETKFTCLSSVPMSHPKLESSKALMAIMTRWDRDIQKPKPDYNKLDSYATIGEIDVMEEAADKVIRTETEKILERVEKSWLAIQKANNLSMTCPTSTDIEGTRDHVQRETQTDKDRKRSEEEDWIASVVKVLHMKPARGKKLLKGQLKEIKPRSSRLIKARLDGECMKCLEAEKKDRKKDEKRKGEVKPTAPNAFDYIMSAQNEKRRNRLINSTDKIKIKVERKAPKEKNQVDIRAYLVGKRVRTKVLPMSIDAEPMTLSSTAQPSAPSTLDAAEPGRRKTFKSSCHGKYIKLKKTTTVAILKESSTTCIGRLTTISTVYGKKFTLLNLSRKEVDLDFVDAAKPENLVRLCPIGGITIAPGATADIPFTVVRDSYPSKGDIFLLRVLHHGVPICPDVPLLIEPRPEDEMDSLLTEMFDPTDVAMITSLRPPLGMPRSPITSCVCSAIHRSSSKKDDDVKVDTITRKEKIASPQSVYLTYRLSLRKKDAIESVEQIINTREIASTALTVRALQRENNEVVHSIIEDRIEMEQVSDIDGAHSALDDETRSECSFIGFGKDEKGVKTVDVEKDSQNDEFWDSSDYEIIEVDDTEFNF